MKTDKLIVKGARQHNLKNIDLEIPRQKLIVFTGLSGSGKSSLAFDTIYAEGQRRYVESLSAYARQFLGQMDKPDLDFIEGLSPAISIDQKTTSRNPRSTVGTVTEIYDYLRLLFARIGKAHCPKCGQPITQQTVEQIVDRVLALGEGSRLQILAPVVKGRKGEHKQVLEDIRRQGFARVRIDGEVSDVNQPGDLSKNKKHTIEIVVDRIVVRPDIQGRLADSLEMALKHGDGVVIIDVIGGEELLFSERLACVKCSISLEELTPRMFSFNSPYGACPQCDGLGEKIDIDPELVINPSLSLQQGGIIPWKNSKSQWRSGILDAVCRYADIDPQIPLGSLETEKLEILLYGLGDQLLSFPYVNQAGRKRHFDASYEGVIPSLKTRFRESSSDWVRREIEQYMSARPCSQCQGQRLKPAVLAVTIGGKNIMEVTNASIRDCAAFFADLELSERDQFIGRQVLKEIGVRLGFLNDVGLEYLTLSRSAGTLSGGEAQRIRLATQIGSRLVGVLYILDEPSIGLHQRDNQRLLRTLEGLRDLGNTVIVVEHDEETIRAADWIVDIGPGAGAHGGEVVASGRLDDVCGQPNSITGQYLSGKKQILVPKKRRSPGEDALLVCGAEQNNLKGIDVSLPLGLFVCITGVSGSGKSTLVNDIIHKKLVASLSGANVRPGKHRSMAGIDRMDKVVNIDQSPIGRTPRSNPATYTKAFDGIREVFSLTPEAKIRGYKPGRFSFNVKGGRCEACSGDGIIKIEMHFLPDVYVPCEVCKGSRYNRETLEVRYKGKNIADVLHMRVEEAAEFFKNVPKVAHTLQTICDVGLGYIRLGQPATQLSGGEAQRVKLASELRRKGTGHTMYILDEPTTGLHFEDIRKLLAVLNRLVDGGNTVLVIEHNLDVIKTADHIIDLGPEGGDNGGQVVAAGTPEEIALVPGSYTGQFLRSLLGR